MPTVAPIGTVSPSATPIFRTPEAGAGTTLVALSVSSSKSGSSALTESAVGLQPARQYPFEIDSPTLGTLIGTLAMISTHSWMCRHGRRAARRGGDEVGHRRAADGRLDDLGLFAVVDQLRAGRRAGAGVPSDVLERLAHQLPSRGDTNVQPPMFCDSSCTQTHSRADLYRSSTLLSCSAGQG